MKEIRLSMGQIALVDDEDFEFLNQRKWYALKRKYTFHAARHNELKRPFNRNVYMHREILSLQKGEICDHKDMNGLNNQRSNLRKCTKAQNAMNINPYVKYKGVSWCKQANNWRAYIVLNNKQIHIGVFKNEDDAALAYNKKAVELYGEFARLNIIM